MVACYPLESPAQPSVDQAVNGVRLGQSTLTSWLPDADATFHESSDERAYGVLIQGGTSLGALGARYHDNATLFDMGSSTGFARQIVRRAQAIEAYSDRIDYLGRALPGFITVLSEQAVPVLEYLRETIESHAFADVILGVGRAQDSNLPAALVEHLRALSRSEDEIIAEAAQDSIESLELSAEVRARFLDCRFSS